MSSDDIQRDIKVRTAKVEQWLIQVLSLLNKECIIDPTSPLKIVLPLRNKLSITLIDPINAQPSNAMSNKKSSISLKKPDDTSMQKVSRNFVFQTTFQVIEMFILIKL